MKHDAVPTVPPGPRAGEGLDVFFSFVICHFCEGPVFFHYAVVPQGRFEPHSDVLREGTEQRTLGPVANCCKWWRHSDSSTLYSQTVV